MQKRPLVIAGEVSDGSKSRAKLEAAGWGRMQISRRFTPYAGEPWAIDNGVYRQWSAAAKAHFSTKRLTPAEEVAFIVLGSPNVVYDATLFVRQYQAALERLANYTAGAQVPQFAVIPDEVGNAEASLLRSFAFLEELNYSRELLVDEEASWDLDAYALAHGLRSSPIPLALAVQDGMTPESVETAAYDAELDRSFLDDVAVIFLGGSAPWKEATVATWRAFATRWGMRLHFARAGTPRKLALAAAAGADSVDSAGFMWSYAKWDAFEAAWHALGQDPTPAPADPIAQAPAAQLELDLPGEKAPRRAQAPRQARRTGRPSSQALLAQLELLAAVQARGRPPCATDRARTILPSAAPTPHRSHHFPRSTA